MRGYFITGTGTDVGKTVIAAALIARARQAGEQVVAIKPAESGCQPGASGDLIPRDASWLAAIAGHEPLCPFRYRAPLAPAHAAALNNERPFKSRLILSMWNEAAAGADLLIAEGAGGLLVPLAGHYLIADLAAEIAAPLLVVARDDLGTINHTALTIECARARRLEVAGFFFSASGAADDERAATNAGAVTAQTGARYLGRLPRLDDLGDAALAAAAAAHLEPI